MKLLNNNQVIINNSKNNKIIIVLKEILKEINTEVPTGPVGEVSHEVTLSAEPIYHFDNFTLTNSLFSSFIVVGVIVIL